MYDYCHDDTYYCYRHYHHYDMYVYIAGSGVVRPKAEGGRIAEPKSRPPKNNGNANWNALTDGNYYDYHMEFIMLLEILTGL
jgi:hypothetical protein